MMIDDTFSRLIFIRICIVLLQYAPLIETALLLTAIIPRYPPSPIIPYAQHIASLVPHSLLALLASPITIILLAALLTTELIYTTTLYLPHKSSLTHEAIHPPLPGQKEREELFDRALASTTDWDEYLKLWFLGSPVEEVKRENVREFLLWAFFDRNGVTKGDNGDIEDELESYLDKIEALIGRKLPPGRGAATSLRLTFDAIETRYRSVVWYGVIALLDLVTHGLLAWWGYGHYRPGHAGVSFASTTEGAAAQEEGGATSAATTATTTLFPPRLQHTIPFSIPSSLRHHTSPTKHLSYYLRPHLSRTRAPVVFIHGIGIGLWSYTTLLSSLNTSHGLNEDDGQIGIIAIEILPISSRLTGSGPDLPAVLTHGEFLRELETVLKYHNTHDKGFPLDKGFTLVTHSYGSTLVAPILRSTEPFIEEEGKTQSLADLTNTLILTDPVSICLHLPAVAYNFTRRPPRTANEWQLWYFASTDLGIARALGRGFFWRENILWREDILDFLKKGKDKRVVICLAGRDLIVDTKSVGGYLGWNDGGKDGLDEGVNWEEEGKEGERMKKKLGNGVEVVWYPRLDHAQMFESRERLRPVLDVIAGKK